MADAILKFQDENGKHTFLSNFYPSPIRQRVYDPNVEEQFSTLVFPTVENFFQAQKNDDVLYKVSVCGATPGFAKRLGRSADLRKDWESAKLGVMRSALSAKFPPVNSSGHQNISLSKMLLDTEDAYLEEGNNWGDRFWGTVSGAGENWLGVLLMARRAELRHYASIPVVVG